MAQQYEDCDKDEIIGLDEFDINLLMVVSKKDLISVFSVWRDIRLICIALSIPIMVFCNVLIYFITSVSSAKVNHWSPPLMLN